MQGNPFRLCIGQQNPCHLFLWLHKPRMHVPWNSYSATVIVFLDIGSAPARGSGVIQDIYDRVWNLTCRGNEG
jgi:hypothetical protein